jgi:Gly-Xaa carboxypeptidase
VGTTKEQDTKTIQALALKFNLSITAFGKQLTDADAPAYGTLELSDAWGAALEPAPITPSTGDEAGAFRLLAGTIKSVYRTHRNVTDDETVIVSPGIMSGNTGMWLDSRFARRMLRLCVDTRHYWALTKNIFRYGHSWTGNRSWLSRGVHTVNECKLRGFRLDCPILMPLR